MYLLSSLVCLYNFREKGLFLGGQNVISWGGTRGDWGAFAPPACMLKKALGRIFVIIEALQMWSVVYLTIFEWGWIRYEELSSQSLCYL
jgi:hypothetical protein